MRRAERFVSAYRFGIPSPTTAIDEEAKKKARLAWFAPISKTDPLEEDKRKVNVPKTKKTYGKSKECRKHTLHKVTQYKKGKDSIAAQGKRRYDRKQSGYGGQTKPVFHKKPHTFSQAAVVLFFTSLVEGGSMTVMLYYLKARFQFNKNQYADLMVISGIGATLTQVCLCLSPSITVC
ncbi:hypothetical protein RJT34_21653 [Clitoria ternatea]|uniref:Uncharacterized protein n=1 Tax=Clitoria ternatea TaxID=43366 RepID=A0AAN9IVK9_CLITE